MIERLQTVLGRHQASYWDALATRGLKADETGPLSVQRLRNLHDTGLPGSVLLIYDYEPPLLDAFILHSASDRIDHTSLEIPLDRLTEALTAMRAALQIDSLVLDRTPTARGLRRSQDATSLSGTTAVDVLSRMILPQALGDRLVDRERLVVVPVRELATVPFALLSLLGDEDCLIARAPVSVAPSVEDLVRQLERNAEILNGRPGSIRYSLESKQPLIVGNPDYGSALQQLPGAQEEAELVASYLDTDALTGRMATADIVRGALKARSKDLLYFATHGAADLDQPLEGCLYFSGAERIAAHEIQEENLESVELVVLSACQTGLGQTHDAGVLGLARAFVLAGVGAVVMSLWNVSDAATMKLMTTMMKTLKSEAREGSVSFPSEALRQAMLATRREHRDPVEWGAFVHYGVPWP